MVEWNILLLRGKQRLFKTEMMMTVLIMNADDSRQIADIMHKEGQYSNLCWVDRNQSTLQKLNTR